MNILLITSLLLVWVILVGVESYIAARKKLLSIIVWIGRVFASIIIGVLFDVHNMDDYFPILLFHITSHIIIFSPLLSRNINNLVPLSGKLSFWYLDESISWRQRLLKPRPTLYKAIYIASAIAYIASIVLTFARFTA